jgi:hypothetical protein
MRKPLARLLLIAAILLQGCTEKVEIQDQPFESQPVVYGIIDPNDTVHYIRLERMFSGMQAPAITAAEADSLFFHEAGVTVEFFPSYGGGEPSLVEAEKVVTEGKDPGYFSSSRQELYRFEKVLTNKGSNIYSTARLTVTVPGLPDATATCKIVSRPSIWSPNVMQMYLFIWHDRPIQVQWSGGSWNEVDISFEIKEMYADSVSTKTISFQKVNDVHINGKYYEVKIPWELLVNEIVRKFKPNPSIIRRYFGLVRIIIHTGLADYANYIQFLGGINDFNENPYSNIENGFGLFCSRSSVYVRPLELDQDSRFELAADPMLSQLGFIEY